MTDATADGVSPVMHTRLAGATLAGRPEDLAEAGTRLPREGRTENHALGRQVKVAVESISRVAGADPWTVRVSMDGIAWDERVPAEKSRDEAVEIAWREVTMRAGALRPASDAGG